MQENTQITVTNLRLSNNPTTSTEDSVDGIGGKVNLTEDGRQFVIMDLEDQTNFRKFHRRNVLYSANEAGRWPAATPKQMVSALQNAAAVGKQITLPGRVVTHNVVPYDINGRSVSTYTTIVLSDENEIKVFESQGHKIMDAEGTIISTQNSAPIIKEAKPEPILP